MRCETCGAFLTEGASVCPQCGKPVDGGVSAASPKNPKSRPVWLIPAVAAVAVIVIAVGAYLFFTLPTNSTGPEGAAMRMMTAFADYDAQSVLDNATHASLTATDQAAFVKQGVDAKTKNKSLPQVKNIKITKVTLASSNAATATVQLSADWLTDATEKTYTTRAETLTVVKQDGKWLVRLFQ
jgi:uncharacterized membrane protein YvbJ